MRRQSKGRAAAGQEFECKPPLRDHRSRAKRGGGNLLFRTWSQDAKRILAFFFKIRYNPLPERLIRNFTQIFCFFIFTL